MKKINLAEPLIFTKGITTLEFILKFILKF